jgi:hypothetical protein
VTLVEQFHAALSSTAVDLPGPELLPERLARACAHVLPVDGAGISLFFADERRLPLGASDQDSAEAERLQFTVGEGPCLTAHATGEPVVADEATIRSDWPSFYDALLTRTEIRSVASIPLQNGLAGVGALDLYVIPPNDIAVLDLGDAHVIAGQVASLLQTHRRPSAHPAEGPVWLDAPAAERRSRVWQAIGFVNSGLGVSSPQALALLRAHAFAANTSLDEIAARLVDREISVEDMSLDADEPR